MRNGYIYPLIMIFLITSPASAETRSISVQNMFDDFRLSPEGFANTLTDIVSIKTTTKVLSLSRLINYEVNSTLDILLYYQRSQNEDGGFGENPEGNSSWEMTMAAIQGLVELRINSSQLSSWQIDSYLNSSANDLLYSTAIENNQTVIRNNDLTVDLAEKWGEYIYASILINVIPPIPNVFLGTELKSFQLNNGTYFDFKTAINAVKLLALLAQEPNDSELASKFIRAFATTDGMFSSTIQGAPSLKDSFDAISALDSFGRLSDLDDQNKIILKILDLQKANSGFTDIGHSEVSVEATWYAIKILALLDSLDQLDSPDVLQTQGFVGISYFAPIITFVAFVAIRRKLT